MADVVVVNKIDSADAGSIERVLVDVASINPRATIVRAASPITLGEGPSLNQAAVLVIEDGPTVTHGGMPFGAGTGWRSGGAHARRPATVRRRLDRRHARPVPAHRPRAPGDGVLGRAAARARGDDQRRRLRRRRQRDDHGSRPARRLAPPDSPRDVRARGDRIADASRTCSLRSWSARGSSPQSLGSSPQRDQAPRRAARWSRSWGRAAAARRRCSTASPGSTRSTRRDR